MKIIKAGYEILSDINGDKILQSIEKAARTCYKSEDLITEDSAKKLVANLLSRGHEAMIEHESLSVKFVCDRGVSHEIVRHRVASYAQESTRYVNYSKGKFGNEITVIEPLFFEKTEDSYSLSYKVWEESCKQAEKYYLELIKLGATPQEARSVLPNSLKTEIVMTANLREWRHFFKLRTAKVAHPQMVEITIPLLKEIQSKIPLIFDDIKVED
jgi:thymidylate synthase (FAD)